MLTFILTKNRVLKVAAQTFLILILLVISVWLIVTVFINFFLDINKLLGQNPFLKLECKSYKISYAKVFPEIILENCNTNFIVAQKASIGFYNLSLLKFFPQINYIHFYDARFKEQKIAITNTQTHNNFVENLINLANHPLTLEFTNLTIDDLSEKITYFWIKNSRLKLKLGGLSENASIKGMLSRSSEDNILDISLKIGQYTFFIQEKYIQKHYTSGSLKISFEEKKDTISQIDILKANLDLNGNKFIIKDILIDNPWMKGQGNISFNEEDLSIQGSFDNLNLNHFIPFDLAIKFLEDLQQNKLLSSDFLKNKTNVNVQVSNLKANEQTINNFLFNLTSQDKSKISQKISGNFDQQGSFVLEGVIQNDIFDKVFTGKVSLKSDDLNILYKNFYSQIELSSSATPFEFSSDIIITPVLISYQNIISNLGKAKVQGNFALRNYGLDRQLEGNLLIQDYDADNASGIFAAYTNQLNDILFESYNQNYEQKFTFLNNKSPINLNVTFENTMFQGNAFNHMHFLIDSAYKKVAVNFFNIKKQDYFLQGAANLTFPSFEPLYKIIIFDGIIPNLELSDMIYFKQFLDTKLNLKNMKIDLSARLGNLSILKNSLQNFFLKVRNVHSTITIDKLDFTLQGGLMSLNGNIFLNPFSANLGYSYNNLNLALLFKDSPILKGLEGVISTNGSLSLTGNSFREILYSLDANGKVLGIGLNLPYLGVDKAIDNITKPWMQKNDPSSQVSQNSNFGNMEGSYKVFQGVLSTNDLHFSNSKFISKAEADLNVYTNQVKFLAKFNLPYRTSRFAADAIMTLKVNGNIMDPQTILETNSK